MIFERKLDMISLAFLLLIVYRMQFPSAIGDCNKIKFLPGIKTKSFQVKYTIE